MSSFRKKPVVIEATQWFKNGDHPLDDVMRAFEDTGAIPTEPREGAIVRYYRSPKMDGQRPCQHCGQIMHLHGWIDTREGGHIVCPGDFVITGVQGERYPCKPDIFAATYDPASPAVVPPKDGERLEKIKEAWADWLHHKRGGGDSLMDTTAQAFERLERLIESAVVPDAAPPKSRAKIGDDNERCDNCGEATSGDERICTNKQCSRHGHSNEYWRGFIAKHGTFGAEPVTPSAPDAAEAVTDEPSDGDVDRACDVYDEAIKTLLHVGRVDGGSLVVPMRRVLADFLTRRSETGTAHGVKWVRVTDELLAKLGEWSAPMQVRVASEQGGELQMEFRRETNTETAGLRSATEGGG